MAQMFCSMQREQMMLVRQELNRVHQLTDELQGIQEDLKKQASREPEVPATVKVQSWCLSGRLISRFLSLAFRQRSRLFGQHRASCIGDGAWVGAKDRR